MRYLLLFCLVLGNECKLHLKHHRHRDQRRAVEASGGDADYPVVEIAGFPTTRAPPNPTPEPPTSTPVYPVKVPGCGNGKVDLNEQCDDGNQLNGDGCSSICFHERCGNSLVDSMNGEQCDDGNTKNDDDCNNHCKLNMMIRYLETMTLPSIPGSEREPDTSGKTAHRAILNLAKDNKAESGAPPTAPRPPKDYNLATLAPASFAAKLTQKLNEAIEERAEELAARAALQDFAATTRAERREFLREAVRHMTAGYDNAQQILDKHVRQVWNSSQVTPRTSSSDTQSSYSYQSQRTTPLTYHSTPRSARQTGSASCSSCDSGLGCRPPPARRVVTDSYSLYGSEYNLRDRRSERNQRCAAASQLQTDTPRRQTVVGWQMCDEPIPYRSQLPGSRISLTEFRQLIGKRGSFKFFFKTRCSDFENSEVVYEEVFDDAAVLPLYEGKKFAKVERLEE